MRIGSRTISLPFKLPPLPLWAIKYGRYAGYPLFGVFVFLLVLYLSLPWDRVKDRLELEAAAAGFDVRIDQMGPAFVLGLKAKNVTLRTRPANPAEKPGRFVFDQISAHPGLFGLLFGHVSASFDAQAFGGDISGFFSRATDTEANLTANGVNLGQIPGLEGFVKLPMSGVMTADGNITMPKGHLAEASGKLKVECTTCTIGDGKAKLPLPNNQFFREGVTVPKIGLGSPEGRLVIEKGTAKISGFEGHSPDMDIKLEGDIALHDPWQFSTANLCLAFRPTPALIKRETMFELLSQSPDMQSAKRGDGYYTVRVSGRLDSMYFMQARCGPSGPGSPTTTAGAPPRPGGLGFHPPPLVNPTGMAVPPPGAPPGLVAPPVMAQPPPPPAQIDAAPAAPPPPSIAPARGAIVAQPPSQDEPPPPQPVPQPEDPPP